jgi:type III secretion protein J
VPTAIRGAAALLLLSACADEEILRGLDGDQAREALAALAEAGIEGREARGDGPEATASVSVPPRDAPRARRLLAADGLPRSRAPGLEQVFGKPGLVPTPVEERARFLLALQGELARTLESLDGVLSARVHLALPATDPLRPEPPRPASGAVLLRCRAGARERLEGLGEGIRRVVAGSADGLAPGAVAVIVVEVAPPPSRPEPERRLPRTLLWLGAGASALAGGAVGLQALRARRPRAA